MMHPKLNQIAVALVITELEVGGAERCLTNLALGLNPQRFAPLVYSLASRPQPPQDALVKQLEAGGVPLRFLDANSATRALPAVRRLRHLWRSDRPQIVQAFLFHANVLTAIATIKRPSPVLSLGFRVSDPTTWRQHTERLFARRAARVVCVSDSVAEFARQKVGVPAQKVVVIPNGVAGDAHAQVPPADLRRLGIPAAAPTIACIARLTEQKGVDRLIRAVPEILRRLPDHHVLLVGDGPQRSPLQQLATRLGVATRVHFAGWQPDTLSILKSCRILVLPSRWEGMPNVLLEAMACGLPVVSTRTDGVAQALGPLLESQTVSEGTPQALAEKAVTICGDRTLREHLGAENQRRAVREFSLDNMIAQYERLFESLADPPDRD
jgi:glycosyltransferase involved in cell wall biosynthesis